MVTMLSGFTKSQNLEIRSNKLIEAGDHMVLLQMVKVNL